MSKLGRDNYLKKLRKEYLTTLSYQRKLPKALRKIQRKYETIASREILRSGILRKAEWEVVPGCGGIVYLQQLSNELTLEDFEGRIDVTVLENRGSIQLSKNGKTPALRLNYDPVAIVFLNQKQLAKFAKKHQLRIPSNA